MKVLSITFFVVFCAFIGTSQTLAIYEFTEINVCPKTSISVTTQPANASFSDFSSTGTSCVGAQDVFNEDSWNMTALIDLLEYNEFTITADPCFTLSLNDFTFSHKASNVTTIPTWYLRSSVDEFTTNLGTGTSSVTIAPTTITLPVNHQNISTVTFRLYVTSAYQIATTWRNDDVSVTGTINTAAPQLYYADADGDSYGDPSATTSACSLPVGYVLDNQDCDDANALINPNTVWFQDLDGDNFGDVFSQSIGCIAPTGYVASNADCDDSDPLVTIANTTYYLDADVDGFGDSTVYQVACSVPSGYVSNNSDCDDSDPLITIPSVVVYEDLDSDGFGNASNSMTVCSALIGYVANSSDCDDTNPMINDNAADVNGNGIDENCDGVDGYLGISDFNVSAFNIYPNPAKDEIFIDFDSKYENSTIRLVDLKGIVMLTNKTASQIDVKSLSSGIYFLQIENDSILFHQRVVLEK
jgi:Secretion system C-terminal sorting domain/Putative metal-binding motif